jgi:hypothetical protein
MTHLGFCPLHPSRLCIEGYSHLVPSLSVTVLLASLLLNLTSYATLIISLSLLP